MGEVQDSLGLGDNEVRRNRMWNGASSAGWG